MHKLYPKSKYPDGHPKIAGQFKSHGLLLMKMTEYRKSVEFFKFSVEMNRKLYPPAIFPNGKIELATSIETLGLAYQYVGKKKQGFNLLQENVEILRKLFPESKFPDGHESLAHGLQSLAIALDWSGQSEKALPWYLESLIMRKKLYPPSKFPRGHPNIYRNLGYVGSAYANMEKYNLSVKYLSKALAMQQQFYTTHSKGAEAHHGFIVTLNSLAKVHNKLGNIKKALELFKKALEIAELHPSSAPNGQSMRMDLLYRVGAHLHALRQPEKALPLYRRALSESVPYYRQLFFGATEVGSVPLKFESYRDRFIAIMRELNQSASETYNKIWPMRSLLTQILQQHYATFRAAGGAATENLEQLRAIKRQIERLMYNNRLKPTDRDKQLVKLNDERERLESKLLDSKPQLKRWRELEQLGPKELLKTLPPGVVFIDVLIYAHPTFDFIDPKKSGSEPRYVAFILAKGQPIRWVELDRAEVINKAIDAWRKAIDVRKDDRGIAQQIHDRVWGLSEILCQWEVIV